MAGKSVICGDCKAEFEYEPCIMFGREMMPRQWCPACMNIRSEAAMVEQKKRDEGERQWKWNAICPPLYRDTDFDRIDRRCAKAAMEWDIESRNGLGLLGTTGSGKTRALFVALRRAFDGGANCRSISHNAFSKLVQTAFSGDGLERRDASAALTGLQKCHILLFDDLGKSPATERADAELEELIEVRTCNLLPILWSANGSSAWLKARLGPDRGEPLVRRLTEFSTIVVL